MLFALKSKEEKLFTAFCYLQPFRQQRNFLTTRLKTGESKYIENRASQKKFVFLKKIALEKALQTKKTRALYDVWFLNSLDFRGSTLTYEMKK
ncbi:MAG: hypothetical protein AN484_28735 [Aphanizomenon flos-aquae WA102]|uniref:Uncharacterized protein n=1 Tax=Aphanizomenon flos-aquae WA102 TaxID=1710896 RepID=A0A1B7W3M6_APHFL|nr:MAG: hypothetical protein AN484_28735 [Aphanizomenon flos-aquae WA102]